MTYTALFNEARPRRSWLQHTGCNNGMTGTTKPTPNLKNPMSKVTLKSGGIMQCIVSGNRESVHIVKTLLSASLEP